LVLEPVRGRRQLRRRFRASHYCRSRRRLRHAAGAGNTHAW
jgi:hypothetical protein